MWKIDENEEFRTIIHPAVSKEEYANTKISISQKLLSSLKRMIHQNFRWNATYPRTECTPLNQNPSSTHPTVNKEKPNNSKIADVIKNVWYIKISTKTPPIQWYLNQGSSFTHPAVNKEIVFIIYLSYYSCA